MSSSNLIDSKMSLQSHLEELRKRIIYSLISVAIVFIFAYWQVKVIFDFVTSPLITVLPENSHLAILKVAEGFFTELKLAIIASFFASAPVIFYQMWKFVAPGLYKHEKKYVIGFVLSASILFFTGASFAYYVVFPLGFAFFMKYADGYVVASLSINWYLSFVMRLLIGFGIVFELPVVALFLAKMGLITHKMMRKYRRYALVVIFVFAAILTPPDIFTQLLMAGPLIFLYEISIYIVKMSEKKKELEIEGDEIYQ